MSSNTGNALGGLLGAALGLYVIHEVLHDGRTGRRLGYVKARSKSHARQMIQRHVDSGKYPAHVRVFYGRDIPRSNNKKRHTKSYNSDNGMNFNMNVKMPRLF